jgi:hypothetical protein
MMMVDAHVYIDPDMSVYLISALFLGNHHRLIDHSAQPVMLMAPVV